MPEKRSLLCGGSILDKYNVKLLSRALHDLDGIYTYIAKTLQEPETALRTVEELEAQILSLETMPYRCTARRTGAYGKGDLAVMSIEAYEQLTSRFELYGLLQKGLEEEASGHVRPFAEAMADLRNQRKK